MSGFFTSSVLFFRRQLLPANHKMDRRRANREGKWCHHHAGGKQDGPCRQKVICSSLFLPLCQWAPSCKSILMKSLIVAAGLSILSSSVFPEVALDLPLCECQCCDSQVFQIALVKDIDDENYNQLRHKKEYLSALVMFFLKPCTVWSFFFDEISCPVVHLLTLLFTTGKYLLKRVSGKPKNLM